MCIVCTHDATEAIKRINSLLIDAWSGFNYKMEWMWKRIIDVSIPDVGEALAASFMKAIDALIARLKFVAQPGAPGGIGTGGGIGGVGGGVLGGFQGAKWGAAAGAGFGPIGIAVGAIVGGLTGGLIGRWAGKKVGGMLDEPAVGIGLQMPGGLVGGPGRRVAGWGRPWGGAGEKTREQKWEEERDAALKVRGAANEALGKTRDAKKKERLAELKKLAEGLNKLITGDWEILGRNPPLLKGLMTLRSEVKKMLGMGGVGGAFDDFMNIGAAMGTSAMGTLFLSPFMRTPKGAFSTAIAANPELDALKAIEKNTADALNQEQGLPA